MTRIAEFCLSPADIEGCQVLLVRAWREGPLDEHCIFEGLRANWHQCLQVLLEGLGDGNLAKSEAGLGEACKQVVFLGYPQEIRALQEVFYRAYYRLVRCVIHRFGIKDDGQPSADDVFQNVFMSMHKLLLKSPVIEGRLATYINRVTVNTCMKAVGEAWKKEALPDEDMIEQPAPASGVFIAPQVVENWEDLDHRLLDSDQGNLINRIILAHQCIEGSTSGKRPSAKQLMTCWQTLSQVPDSELAALHEKAAVYLRRFPAADAAHITADMINLGLAEPNQVAVVFAASAGLELKQIWELIDELNKLSAGAIHTRICRIYMVLQPPGAEER